MTQAQRAEMTARKMIERKSTEDLVQQFELTNLIEDEDICIVRGWIMDELEKRDEQAFDAWISDFAESPREYFI